MAETDKVSSVIPPAAQTIETSSEGRGTVIVDGTSYAVGLMWQPLQNPDNPLPEIKEALEAEPDADLYCLRSTISPQYGIGKKALGHKDGEPSLAAAVASYFTDKESVCAVFRVKEGWWFVAIRNDLILSEEDTVYKTETEAQHAFFAMMAVPDWEIKITPQSWAIENSQEVPLEDIVKKTHKTRLMEMNAFRRTSVLFLLALGIILLLGGLVYLIVSLWETVFTEEKIVALPTPEVIKPIEPVPEKPKPWEKIVEPGILIGKCWNNAYQLSSMTIPGWQLGNVVCTPKGISTSWRKSWPRAGRAAYLKAAINQYKISKINISIAESGDSATGTISFADMPVIASVPTLTPKQIQDDLVDIRQATGIQFNFQQQTIMDPPNNPDGSIPPNQQIYVYYFFSIRSAYTPWEWKVFFDKFSGLELTQIEYNPSVGVMEKWKYEGKIYAK